MIDNCNEPTGASLAQSMGDRSICRTCKRAFKGELGGWGVCWTRHSLLLRLRDLVGLCFPEPTRGEQNMSTIQYIHIRDHVACGCPDLLFQSIWGNLRTSSTILHLTTLYRASASLSSESKTMASVSFVKRETMWRIRD